MNDKQRLEIAIEALKFYCNGKHFKTTRVPLGALMSEEIEIIDEGEIAGGALKQIQSMKTPHHLRNHEGKKF